MIPALSRRLIAQVSAVTESGSLIVRTDTVPTNLLYAVLALQGKKSLAFTLEIDSVRVGIGEDVR